MIIEPYEHKFRSLLIFGPPGAGKGTIGKMLANSGGEYHLSSGDIFRNLSPESPAGKVFHQYAGKGLLLPDEVVLEICKHYVAGLIATNRYDPKRQFLLLDGLPRTVRQAELFDDMIEVRKIIVLEIENYDILIRRLRRRALLEKRADDAVDIIRTRLESYEKQTAQVLAHYPQDLIHRFNGEQRPLEVLRDVLVELADALSENYQQP